MSSFTRLVVVPVVALTPLFALPMTSYAEEGSGDGTTSTVASDDPSTTSPSTTNSVETSTTQGRRGGGAEVAKKFGDLISRVEKSNLPPEIKDPLLARLRSARDAFVAGTPPTEADVQALLRDVLAALGGTPPGDEPRPATSVASVPSGDEGPGTTAARPRTTLDASRVLAQLDEWAQKIGRSTLSAADKTAMNAAIDGLRTAVQSGTLKPGDLELVKNVVKSALERNSSGTTPASGPVAPNSTNSRDRRDGATGNRRHKGRAALDSAIEAIGGSELPDGVKQQILEVLGQAKATLEDPATTPEQAAQKLRELHDARRAERLQNAATRLNGFSNKIAALAVTSSQLPGATDVIADVHDKLLQADTLLAGPLDVATIKAAWKLLHEARKELQQFVEAAMATTTTRPAPTAVPQTTIATA